MELTRQSGLTGIHTNIVLAPFYFSKVLNWLLIVFEIILLKILNECLTKHKIKVAQNYQDLKEYGFSAMFFNFLKCCLPFK